MGTATVSHTRIIPVIVSEQPAFLPRARIVRSSNLGLETNYPYVLCTTSHPQLRIHHSLTAHHSALYNLRSWSSVVNTTTDRKICGHNGKTHGKKMENRMTKYYVVDRNLRCLYLSRKFGSQFLLRTLQRLPGTKLYTTRKNKTF